jgi:hypothetical protein
MNLEQSISTNLPDSEVLDRSVELLSRSDFRLRSRQDNRAEFVRGKSRPISRRVDELPQEVTVELEHGLVRISASVEPRGTKDRSQHVDLMMPVIRGLEQILEDPEQLRSSSAEIRQAHASAGTLWTPGEIACLIALVLFLGGVAGAVVLYLLSS